MPKTSYAPAIQTAVLSALSTGPKTHRELHVIVSSEMAFNHGVVVTPQNVRSRTSELARTGLVRQAGRVQSRKNERHTVTLWARA